MSSIMQMGQEFTGGQKPSKRNKLVIAGAVLIVLLAAAAGFFFWQYINLKDNPNEAAQATTQRLVDKVGKLYALPQGEPTVAEINDKEKLKEQPFFQNAQNGDYLLIYTDAKLAILYREHENKLINVGPIAITPEQQNEQQQTE